MRRTTEVTCICGKCDILKELENNTYEKGRADTIKELIDWISMKGFRECNHEMNETIKHLWELKNEKEKQSIF